jgi:hypothetical protein
MNKQNTPEEKSGFMQGWGLIILIIAIVIAGLAALKFVIG